MRHTLFLLPFLFLTACGSETSGPDVDTSGRDDGYTAPGPGSSSATPSTPIAPGTKSFRIGTAAEPTNAGIVTRDPAAERLAEGTSVTITAEPAVGFRLARWEGAASGNAPVIDVTITRDTEIVAVFERTPVQLVVGTNIPEAGAVTITPAKASYAVGDTVTLTPPRTQSFSFAKWKSGTSTIDSSSLTITLTGDTNVTAIMLPVPFLEGPSSVTGPVAINLQYGLYWGSASPQLRSTMDTFVVEQATSINGPFTEIDRGMDGTLATEQLLSITRNIGTYYYRVRAQTQYGATSWSPVVRVDRLRAPLVLRIVNDLPGGPSWSAWNQIIRLRVSNDANGAAAAPERLSPISPSYRMGDSILTGATRDFDVEAFAGRASYHVYVQTGWWDNCIETYGTCFEVHTTQVYGCGGMNTVAYKYAGIIVSGHTEGVHVMRMSQYLPAYHYYQSNKCGG